MMFLVRQRTRRWARVHRLGGGGVWTFMEFQAQRRIPKMGMALLGLWAGCLTNNTTKAFNDLLQDHVEIMRLPMSVTVQIVMAHLFPSIDPAHLQLHSLQSSPANTNTLRITST